MDTTQKKGSRKRLRGRFLGHQACTKRSMRKCEKSAARRQTLREWCREVLPEPAAGPAQAPEAEVILSEIPRS